MIADLPIAAKFGVTEFNCAATELSHEETLVLCGDIPKRAVRIVHAVDAFTVDSTYKPQARLSLKFPSASAYTAYEVVSIAKAPDLLSYETVLKADNRA
jgi:hypothetical protein